MKTIAIALALALTACQGNQAAYYQERTPLLRDVTGAGRGMDALRTDEAQCRYELAMAQYSRPYVPGPSVQTGDPGLNAGLRNLQGIQRGAPPGTGELCMRAKGWEIVGYE